MPEQGGGLLGHVTVPKTYKAPGSQKVELAYITKKEAKKLKELDLHNSGIGKEMHYGPMGIPNYNGGGGGFGGGFGGDGGGGGDDIREAARSVGRSISRSSRRGGEDRDFVSAAVRAVAPTVSFDPSAAVVGGAPNVSAAVIGGAPTVSTAASKPTSYVTKPYVNTLAGTTTPPVGTASSPTVTAFFPSVKEPSDLLSKLGRRLAGTVAGPFKARQHFKNQQVYENLAKQGIISGAYADRLKGMDLVNQRFNPAVGLMSAVPYQVLSNTYDQYDPNNPWGSLGGGVTSGWGQGVSNIQGILGYNPESNQ